MWVYSLARDWATSTVKKGPSDRARMPGKCRLHPAPERGRRSPGLVGGDLLLIEPAADAAVPPGASQAAAGACSGRSGRSS